MSMSNRGRFGAAADGVRAGQFDLQNLSGLLHEQVRGLILSRIEAGEWPSGAPITPEVELSRSFGVSIGTVRKAMDQLVRDRILVRERGRGTFVKDGRAWRTGPGVRLCGAGGLPVEVDIRLVAIDYVVASPSEVSALGMLRPASIVPRALKLSREWRHDGTLIVVETIIVDAARFPNLQFEIDPTAEMLFPTYAEKYHAAVDRTVWTMKPLALGDAAASPLRGGRDVTVMRCVRTAYDAKDAPLELAEQIIVFDDEMALIASQ
jgi:GntR family transcriptional regulator